MKFLIAVSSLLFAQNVFAVNLEIDSCADAEPQKKYIVDSRAFSNGQIKLYVHDVGEPAAAPVGVQITYSRGNPAKGIPYENFCVYVSGLSDVSLKKAIASYDEASNTLFVYAPSRRYYPDGDKFISTVTTFTIRKEGRRAANIFSATAD